MNKEAAHILMAILDAYAHQYLKLTEGDIMMIACQIDDEEEFTIVLFADGAEKASQEARTFHAAIAIIDRCYTYTHGDAA